MKFEHGLLAALLLLSTFVFAASDWVNRIVEIIPVSVTLTDVQEKPDFLQIIGHACDNSDISSLLRAIDKADLGSPNLQKVERKNGISYFVLRVNSKH